LTAPAIDLFVDLLSFESKRLWMASSLTSANAISWLHVSRRFDELSSVVWQKTYRKWLIGKTRTERVLFSGSAKFGSGGWYCRGWYYGRGCYYDLIPTPKKSYWGMSNAYYPMKLIDFCMKYNNYISFWILSIKAYIIRLKGTRSHSSVFHVQTTITIGLKIPKG